MGLELRFDQCKNRQMGGFGGGVLWACSCSEIEDRGADRGFALCIKYLTSSQHPYGNMCSRWPKNTEDTYGRF